MGDYLGHFQPREPQTLQDPPGLTGHHCWLIPNFPNQADPWIRVGVLLGPFHSRGTRGLGSFTSPWLCSTFPMFICIILKAILL